MHERFACRIVGIIKEKKLKEGSKAAEAYVKRVCKGASPAIWADLKAAQERANGWNLDLAT